MISSIANSLLPSLEHVEKIANLNNDEIFLPYDVVHGTVLPGITMTALALAAVYSFLVRFCSSRALGEKSTTLQQRKFSYQMTNLLMNTLLGLGGLYYDFFYRKSYKNTALEDTINAYDEFLIFSIAQLGFQLWAIPIGIFFVNESPAMIGHHMAVIIVTCMSAFLRNGFRYWTPFFYGGIELSSIPLAVMNSFKENNHWIDLYPTQYLAARLIFAASFLSLRILIFVPRIFVFLKDHLILFTSSNIIPFQVFMSIVWLSALFLMILQLFWGILIVKGLVKLIPVSNKKGSKKTI